MNDTATLNDYGELIEAATLKIQRMLPADRGFRLNIGAGWHAHLDILADRAAGEKPLPHRDHWTRLKKEYDRRLPVWPGSVPFHLSKVDTICPHVPQWAN